MKFFIIISVTTTLFFSYMAVLPVARTQSVEYPDTYFEKFTFDSTLRGSFNLSECVKELINCFELVRPDVLCGHRNAKSFHDTVCGYLRETCHDYYGNYDSYGHRFQMTEEFCYNDKTQQWT